jgi:hypothetical protein
VVNNRWNLKLNYCFTVPYVNAAASVLYQYPPVYGGPHVMFPSMAVLQPATALLQAPGSQPNIPVTATCKQESKVGQQCLDVCVLFNVTRLALRIFHMQCTVLLSSTVLSRYYNCCTDDSTSPGNYGYPSYINFLPLLCAYISYR